jgi:hypothetical protein
MASSAVSLLSLGCMPLYAIIKIDIANSDTQSIELCEALRTVRRHDPTGKAVFEALYRGESQLLGILLSTGANSLDIAMWEPVAGPMGSRAPPLNDLPIHSPRSHPALAEEFVDARPSSGSSSDEELSSEARILSSPSEDDPSPSSSSLSNEPAQDPRHQSEHPPAARPPPLSFLNPHDTTRLSTSTAQHQLYSNLVEILPSQVNMKQQAAPDSEDK